MKKTHFFEANDGSQFATAEECKNYESASCWKQLANLEADIGRAVMRTDLPLADALEIVGAMITAKRRADGDLRRKVAEKAAPK